MKKKTESGGFPLEKLVLYDKLIEAMPGLERKGDTVPYTSLNGHMFSFLAKDGTLALRLPQKAREEFLMKFTTTLVEAYGIILKEYVSVSEELLKDTQELEPYFALSFDYVKGLKPKPTKKGNAG